jgi:hypothetical protein
MSWNQHVSTAELYARLTDEERAAMPDEERAAVFRLIAAEERRQKIMKGIGIGLLLVLFILVQNFGGGGGWGRYNADLYELMEQD